MRILLYLFALFASSSILAAGQELPDYAPDKITNRIYVIHGPVGLPTPENLGFMNNPLIAIGDEGVVIVDPGSSLYAGRMVLRQVKKLTEKPVTHVFSTHVHGDHWLGNEAIKNLYPNAKFLAHPVMIQMATDGEAQSWLDSLTSLTEGATDGTTAHIPDQPLVDGQLFELPGMTLKIYLTDHAHTKTDAMIEFVEDSVLVLGDNGLYGRIARMDDGSFKGNIEALDRAIAVGAKFYVPGHGKTSGTEAASKFRDYLSSIYTAAVTYTEEMMAPFEIKQQIQDQFGFYRNWSGFDSEFGKHVSLAVLEAEQDAF